MPAPLQVTLGGDYEEKEAPGKGLVKKGTKGQVFTTAASAKIEHEGTYYIKGEVGPTPAPLNCTAHRPRSQLRLTLARANVPQFGAGIPIYWMGSYGGLEVQDFVLEVRRLPPRLSPLRSPPRGGGSTTALKSTSLASRSSGPPHRFMDPTRPHWIPI